MQLIARSSSCPLILTLAALGLLAGPAPAARLPSVDKLNKKIENVTLKDASGKPHSLYDCKDQKAIVVLFLSFDCPVSNSYAPLLAELARTHAGRKVVFVAVNSSDEGTAAEIARKAAEFKLPFPVFKDDRRVAADAFKAESVPSAFVLDHNFVLRYRGRIDNGYHARLRKNIQTTRNDLREALDEVLAGKAVSEPATLVVGCPIPHDREPARTGKVTYYRDVVPILQARCQECHRPGEVGPFSLMTYRQAVNWAGDIKEFTRDHKMPPWKPVEGPAFHNDRKMSEKEIATLAAWVDGGTPAGDIKDAPPPRRFVEGWRLGKPDLVLTVADDFTVGPAGLDLFRCFVLPTNLTEDRYVVAVDVRPRNHRIAHHSLNFLDRTGQGRKLEQKEKDRVKKPEEQDHGPGYSVKMGIGFRAQGGLGGWAPGNQPHYLPDGAAFFLPRGSDVIVQMHYHRNGRVEKDRPSIGLYFAKKPVARPWKGMVIRGNFWAIPPDKERYPIDGGIVMEDDCKLYSVMPHMHMLGREIKVSITPPTGKPYSLIAIKDWDYNWQETYFLKKPIDLKAGTKVRVDAIYDNSKHNPNNPFNPPRMVVFGEQTDNEMCFIFLGATNDKPGRIRFHQESNPWWRQPKKPADAPANKEGAKP